jgi:predicted acylesterase/phospholipase RssA
MNKLLNLSGAATKIGGLYGVAEALMVDKAIEYDVITGISSGALLSVPLAMGKFEALRSLVINFGLKDIFDSPPVNKEGKLTLKAMARVAMGKLGLGTQNNLALTLSKVITEQDFKKYREGDYARVYIGAVDYISGSKVVFDVKSMGYGDYIKAVIASSSIPVYVDPVVMGDKALYDGGVRDHIMTRWALDNLEVTECTSIYSRPQDFEPKPGYKLKSAIDVIKRTLDIMMVELSSGDEKEEVDKCEALSIPRKAYYLPRLMDSQYDTDKAKLKLLYELGRKQVINEQQIG